MPITGLFKLQIHLAYQRFNQRITKLIEKVNDVTKKVQSPIPAAKLQKYTTIRAKRHNATRWSSTEDMLNCYEEIKEYVTKLDIRDLTGILPSSGGNKHILT